MQPDNLHEILRQSKVLPLSLGRDGEMWWPDGLLLDGIKKRLPAYREVVLPKERAEFDAALDAVGSIAREPFWCCDCLDD